VGRPPIEWKWEAKAKIIHMGGFIPQKIVCKILEKKVIIILEVGV